MWFARDCCLILSTFLNVTTQTTSAYYCIAVALLLYTDAALSCMMWNLCNIYDSFDIFNFNGQRDENDFYPLEAVIFSKE